MMRLFRRLALAALLDMFVLGPAWAGCVLETFATLPVTVKDSRPLATAKINGADATFLVDSGAFYNLITPAKAAEYNLKLYPLPPWFTIRGVGGEASTSEAVVKQFTFVGVPIKDMSFVVGGSETGGDTAGVLGRNLLSIADAEFDLAGGTVKLFRPKGCGDRPLVYWSSASTYGEISLVGEDQGPFHAPVDGFVQVNGHKMRALFDTGSGKSILSVEAAKRAGIEPEGPGVVSAGLTSGIGPRQINTWIAPVDSLEMGGEAVKHTHLRVGPLALTEVDMLIGADFFLSHHVVVSNSQRKLYFTYNGGPVFDLTVNTAQTAAPEPIPRAQAAAPAAAADPADLARRGEALASRADYPHAIDDLTQAIALAPREPAYLFDRAGAYEESGQSDAAMADLDRALALEPANLAGLQARARLRLAQKQTAGALEDLASFDRLASKQTDARLTAAELYQEAEAHTQALAQYELWIAAHPVDSRRAEALAGSCRARIASGGDLAKALADCNVAVRLSPNRVEALISRGLIRLRQQDPDKAVADFGAALAIEPKAPWALYGRGLAERRKGSVAQGEADMAAAVALKPDLPDRAKAYGVGE
jgi:tetratricopeptide (TPR) repeat protein/predicted aspartyl protease